jgi:hypothetical protein
MRTCRAEDRAQAALQLAAALRAQAQVRQKQQQPAAAEQCLQQAAACLQESAASTRQELPLLSDREALLDKVLGLFIDLQVGGGGGGGGGGGASPLPGRGWAWHGRVDACGDVAVLPCSASCLQQRGSAAAGPYAPCAQQGLEPHVPLPRCRRCC